MKKILAAAASAVMLTAALTIGASAATVELKPVEDLKNVFEHSEFQYENNQDLGIPLYTRSKTGDQYLTFKADGSITGFQVGLQKCAGFYDPDNVTRDINFFVSSDNKNWTKVDVSEGATTFNSDIYLNEKQAYWWNSTVSSKAISGSPSYLKIVVKDSPVAGAPGWNIAIDSVKLTTAAAVTPTKDAGGDNSAKGNSSGSDKAAGSFPSTGENTLPLVSVAALSVLSAGILTAAKSKKK